MAKSQHSQAKLIRRRSHVKFWEFPGKLTILYLCAAISLLLGGWQLWVRFVSPTRDLEERPSKTAWDYPQPVIPDDTSASYQALLNDARNKVIGAVGQFPDDPNALAALALFHYLCLNRSAEIECWTRCLAVAPGHPFAYERLVARYEESGEYRQIVELMTSAIEKDPDNVTYHGYLGSALMRMHRGEEAKILLENLHRRVSGDAETHFVLGKIYGQLGQLGPAERSLETAFALDPLRVDVWFSLASVYGKLGEKQKAASYLAQFQELKKRQLQMEGSVGRTEVQDEAYLPPRVAQILDYAGKAHWFAGDMKQAEACFLDAAEVYTEDTDSRKFLSDICQTRGRLDEALRWVLELRKIEPNNLIHYRNEGMLYARLGRQEQAEKIFLALTQVDPTNGFAYLALAELHLQGDPDAKEARVLAARAVEVEPTAYNYSMLANICSRTGDPDGASAAIERAVELEPTNPRFLQMRDAIRGKL